MQARSAALRKDKSQGVFLADVEDRIRVAYDPAAAHDLASGDIELRQTGMSTFDFVGISGERIPGGIVGSTTVVTGVEEDLGRPVVMIAFSAAVGSNSLLRAAFSRLHPTRASSASAIIT